jgi:ribonuclease HI
MNRDGKGSLRVFQANIGKSSPAHDCALALADTEQYDIVLLQEPWTAIIKDQCLTKTHPSYDTFSPVDHWTNTDTRPRVMSYIRRRPSLLADQVRPATSRDILWLKVNDVTVVNFYRQPGYDTALETLLHWPIPPKCLVAGDFNAKHPAWQTGRPQHRGEAIASWASRNELALLNEIDVPTNPRGNTIDLAFSNISLAEATIEDHLATSSDHFTLSVLLPELRLVSAHTDRVRLSSDEEVKRFVEIVEATVTNVPINISTHEQLDTLAYNLVTTLQKAVKAAGRPAYKRGKSAPWWTEECASAAAEYRVIRRAYPLGFCKDVQMARRDFQRIARREKRRYWRELINNLSDSSSIFKAARWFKSPGPFQPPPLQVGDVVYETQQEKAEALRHATLERRTSENDIPDPWETVNPPRKVPFSTEVTPEEVKDAILRAGNTSPGADNITVKLLRASWHAIAKHVCSLFQGCLASGYHPKAFREAEVVMIPKPGRRDLTSPRSWRPISLLSCLGKGLERLVAGRLAWASIHYGVLHPQQCGALPKRSAVDLVAALIHDIEEAFAKDQVVTLVTMDIQGAFDTVMRNRLTARLREQGWPERLARWVHSFMSDRSARIRYQDITTPSSPLQCGLPQGSPVSPVLFLLYTEPIYRLGKAQSRFGYADDTAILCIGDSLDATAAEATQRIDELVDWGAANGVSFDPAKTEVMHFSRKRTAKDSPPVMHGDMVKRPEAAIRWLGIWLDRTLSFKTHVEKWTAKAQAVARHLRSLTNTKHGPRSSLVRQAVRACVEPVLLFGAEAWYPGLTRPSWWRSSREVSTKIKSLIKKMSKCLKQSMRAVLPVWRTTPIAALHRESGIPPVVQLLEASRLRFAARLKSLDAAHPLASRTRTAIPPAIIRLIKRKYQQAPAAPRTRLRRADELLPSCKRPVLLQHCPSKQEPLQTASKEDTAADFRDWLQEVPPLTLVVYSDGSKTDEGAAGYGFVVHQDGQQIARGCGRLGPAEVFDAEATGALEGLKAALEYHGTFALTPIIVCLDNIAAARCLRGKPSDSSQDVFIEFQHLAATHGATTVRWVPGHTGIPGNEEADAQAKAGCLEASPASALPTLAYLRRAARQRPKDEFQVWWEESAPEQYRALKLPATMRCPSELNLPRGTLHHLLAARSQHGDFAEYHERFEHADAQLLCSCGRRKTPSHIFYCRKVPPRCRMRLAPSPTAAVNRAIGKNFNQFIKVARGSAFFEKVCLRY